MAAVGKRGTVTEASGFNPEDDAQKIYGAMKGAGTNEATIIEILAHRTIAQRQKIKEAFKQSVGKVIYSILSFSQQLPFSAVRSIKLCSHH